MDAKARQLEALNASIGKLRPEFSPTVNGAFKFAMMRLGQLTPKEQGLRSDLSPEGEKLSQVEQNRRWRCHALAEFWEDPEIGDKLQNNNVTISKGMEFIKVARAQRRAEDANQEVVDEVSYGSFQDVAKSMDDESVELIFADPPWDSESVGLYEDLAAIAGRVLIPGGASGSPFPAGTRKAPIAS